MNVIEKTKEILQNFSEIQDVCNNINIDFTDDRTDTYGLSPTGDTLLYTDILGIEARQHNFILYAVYQAVNDFDRLNNNGVLLRLQQYLEHCTDDYIAINNGYITQISCANGMLYNIPQSNNIDNVMYQLQINVKYRVII